MADDANLRSLSTAQLGELDWKLKMQIEQITEQRRQVQDLVMDRARQYGHEQGFEQAPHFQLQREKSLELADQMNRGLAAQEQAKKAGYETMHAHLNQQMNEARQQGHVTRQWVHDVAVAASQSVTKSLVPSIASAEQLRYHADDQTAKAFETGMRKAINEWSHSHNHEMKQAMYASGHEITYNDLHVSKTHKHRSQGHSQQQGFGIGLDN